MNGNDQDHGSKARIIVVEKPLIHMNTTATITHAASKEHSQANNTLIQTLVEFYLSTDLEDHSI